jgi:CBS domain-containing protein
LSGLAVSGKLKPMAARRSQKANSVAPDATVAEAARLMNSCGCRELEVRRARRLVGTLSLLDLIVRMSAERRDPERTLVRELMRPRRESPNPPVVKRRKPNRL